MFIRTKNNNFNRVLSVLFLSAGLVMISCETEEPIGGENTEQGGNENNGGENGGEQEEPKSPATLSLGKVTATTAMFTGHFNVAASDLFFSQVTVYYSDAETLDIDRAQSVCALPLNNQQNFTITLTNLKYGTKYNYRMVAEVKSEKTYGEVLSLITENITISELSVVPNYLNAEISGSVTGLSEDDKECIRIGVLYSSEESEVESGEGSKVDVTEISSDGTFSITMSDLTDEAKYFYCGYVCQGDSYTYGTPAEFTTLKHPYEQSSDLDVASATDLSFAASANCYIISESGLYKFNTVKGNSNESVGDVVSASILWESFGTSTVPELLDLISGFCYKDGYIVFQTVDAFKEGNAVVAAKDAAGNILWSWHIWFTDQPEEQVYYNNAGTMMDRNLGATSAIPGDVGALGLLYQWGRKDPFLGSSSINNVSVAKSTTTWPSSALSDPTNGTLAYATSHPITFIGRNEYNRDWYYTGTSDTDDTRWTTSDKIKSIYDPCPSGWRVPDGDFEGIWSKASGSSEGIMKHTFDNVNCGFNFSGKFGSDPTIWYPAAGCRLAGGDGIYDVGGWGQYWSASPHHSEKNQTAIFDFSYNGSVYLRSNCLRVFGQSVRCAKE